MFKEIENLLKRNAERNGSPLADGIDEIEIVFVDFATIVEKRRATVIATQTRKSVKIEKRQLDMSDVATCK